MKFCRFLDFFSRISVYLSLLFLKLGLDFVNPAEIFSGFSLISRSSKKNFFFEILSTQ